MFGINKCNCHSYNGGEGSIKERILVHPKTSKEISVDNCIGKVIQALLDSDISVISSCCGHGYKFPSIVVADRHDSVRAKKIIEAVDDMSRRWEIKAWVLVDVAIALNEKQ